MFWSLNIIITFSSLICIRISLAFDEDVILQAQPIHPTFTPEQILLADMSETQNDDDLSRRENPFLDCSYTKKLDVGEFGTIKSPFYPKNYPRHQKCQWNLESPPNTQIEAVIFDFHTKPWHTAYFDYLTISRNGLFTDNEKLFGDLNDKTPLTFLSKSNKFSLEFISSTFSYFRGFKLQYFVKSSNRDLTLEQPLFLKGTCGSSFLLSDSKQFPNKSPNGLIRPHDKGKSFGGDRVKPFSYPWMAALLIGERNFCGGTLIDDRHILTAAHCTDKVRRISIMLGTSDLGNSKVKGSRGSPSKSRMIFNVTQTSIFQHPDYNRRTLTHDISIIRLPKPVHFTKEIQPICLPNKYFLSKTFQGRSVQVAGWGKTKDCKGLDVSIIGNTECRKTFKGIITGNKLCVETHQLSSPCKGDSGGPLMVIQEGHFMQVGIVSFGTNSCERGKPVGFTRITAFLDFITQVTGHDSL